MEKLCGRCGQVKAVEEFGKAKRSADGLAWWCRPCARAYARKWREENLERARATRAVWLLRERYDISPDAYASMLQSCGGQCPICQDAFDDGDFNRNPVVDHDHACCPGKETCGKCVRGLLCRQCNMSLGRFESHADPIDMLRRAVAYLETTNAPSKRGECRD